MCPACEPRVACERTAFELAKQHDFELLLPAELCGMCVA
jgi:hypothetical protein